MFFYVKFMFIYVKIKKKLILFINIPIEKILEDFQIPRENPRVRELILAEFLKEFENPRGFPHVFLVRK